MNRKTLAFLLTLSCVFLAGCSTAPELVHRLSRHSITYRNTEKIVLIASEGGYGSWLKVTITEDFWIQEIWDAIHQSRPYDIWAASGYRTLEFYRKGEPDEPAATLLVNVTDACHVRGTTDRFRCPKMHSILTPPLELEYKRRKEKGLAPY